MIDLWPEKWTANQRDPGSIPRRFGSTESVQCICIFRFGQKLSDFGSFKMFCYKHDNTPPRNVENQTFNLCPPLQIPSPHNPCYIWRICDLVGKVGSLIASPTLSSCHKIDLRPALLPSSEREGGTLGLTRPPLQGVAPTSVKPG